MIDTISHYFDWAATSPLDKDIFEETFKETCDIWGNPSSLHAVGKKAHEELENSRKKCAALFGVSEKTLYWTSGGTESNHIVLTSTLNRPQKGDILISAIEHPAIREMAMELKKCGMNIITVPVNSSGIVTADAVINCLTDKTVLVCVMLVNNETGAIQPIKEISDAIKKATIGKRQPKIHVDCVQALGKIPFDLKEIGIDSASFSAHKISGPRGIGLLYLKDAIEPFLKGGGQEKGIRSGTENVFGAVAFSKCIEKYSSYATKNAQNATEIKTISDYFIKELTKISGCLIIPENRILHPENYSPYIVQASFKNIPGEVMLRSLDNQGFYISTGSACSSKKQNRAILDAMHIPNEQSENAVRFSFGYSTTMQAVDELLSSIRKVVFSI